MPRSTNYDKQVFAKNLNDYMAAFEMNKTELAKRMGVSNTIVSYWASGEKLPRMDKIQHLSKIFGCTNSDLLDEHDAAKDPTIVVLESIVAQIKPGQQAKKAARIIQAYLAGEDE